MRERLLPVLTLLSKPAVALGASALVALVAVGVAWQVSSVSPSGTSVAAVDAAITETVDVSGTVQSAEEADLAFQTSGQVAAVPVDVGAHVARGATLVALDGRAQAAALAGAKANLEVQQAKLDALNAGTRPEQIAVDETALAQADAALTDAVRSAYVTADDAVHVKADQVFTNPRSSSAKLSVTVSDATLVNTVESERVALEPVLVSWQAALATQESTDAASADAHLFAVSTFLDHLAAALAETPAGGAVSPTTLAGYQASINAARASVSNARTALTGARAAESAAQGALTLAKAGATVNDLNAQQALVHSAEAAVASAEVALSQTVMSAPVSGTVTVQNAHVGQVAVPGVPLVSIIADGKFEAEASVSQADLAKVQVGEAVEATFDAYPGQTFAASVTRVDPAATVENGVASYKVTVTFAENDPRIQAGLDANLRIIAQTKEHALVVPKSAVITDDTNHFVYLAAASGTPEKRAVEVGLTSDAGMVEITNGLIAGDRVLMFGSAAR